jgi:hypothetical protein
LQLIITEQQGVVRSGGVGLFHLRLRAAITVAHLRPDACPAQFGDKPHRGLLELQRFAEVDDIGARPLRSWGRNTLFLEFGDDAFHSRAKANVPSPPSSASCQAIITDWRARGVAFAGNYCIRSVNAVS